MPIVVRGTAVRLVLDTNTVVSGLLWGSVSAKVFDAALAGTIELFTSDALMLELADADLIVSGDADLLNLKRFHHIEIINSSAALARIARAAQSPG